MLRNALLTLCLSACFTADTASQKDTRGLACKRIDDCQKGLICGGGFCTQACETGDQCLANESCVGGFCAAGLSIDASCAACEPTQDCVAGQCTCVSGGNCPGCCVSGVCVVDITSQSCGAQGSLCVSCSGLTPACEGGVCTASCDSSACGAGCCTGAGCQPGTQPEACGLSGACKSCIGSAAGSACVLNGEEARCGCDSAADCAQGQACDPTTNTCSTACSPASPCNDGCCGTDGKCAVGTQQESCGATGTLCKSCTADIDGVQCVESTRECGCNGSAANCASSPKGHACIDSTGECGCNVPEDCGAGLTCITGLCQPAQCLGNDNACTGSCCTNPGPTTGVCAGTDNEMDTQCGSDGNTCVNCTTKGTNKVCVSGSCGCNSELDCAVGEACTNHVCGKACLGAKCNESCCGVGNLCEDVSDTCECNDDPDCSVDPKGSKCRAIVGSGDLCGCSTIKGGCSVAAFGSACLSSKCGCNGAGDCAGRAPRTTCDATAHKCVECQSSTTCTNNPNGPICLSAANDFFGQCGCDNSTQCTNARGGKKCLDDHGCGCAANTDCNGVSAGSKCQNLATPSEGDNFCGCTVVQDCPTCGGGATRACQNDHTCTCVDPI